MFDCADANFVVAVTDPALAGGTGSPGGLLGGGSIQPGGAGEARGPCFYGNTDLATSTQEEKCQRRCEHR